MSDRKYPSPLPLSNSPSSQSSPLYSPHSSPIISRCSSLASTVLTPNVSGLSKAALTSSSPLVCSSIVSPSLPSRSYSPLQRPRREVIYSNRQSQATPTPLLEGGTLLYVGESSFNSDDGDADGAYDGGSPSPVFIHIQRKGIEMMAKQKCTPYSCVRPSPSEKSTILVEGIERRDDEIASGNERVIDEEESGVDKTKYADEKKGGNGGNNRDQRGVRNGRRSQERSERIREGQNGDEGEINIEKSGGQKGDEFTLIHEREREGKDILKDAKGKVRKRDKNGRRRGKEAFEVLKGAEPEAKNKYCEWVEINGTKDSTELESKKSKKQSKFNPVCMDQTDHHEREREEFTPPDNHKSRQERSGSSHIDHSIKNDGTIDSSSEEKTNRAEDACSDRKIKEDAHADDSVDVDTDLRCVGQVDGPIRVTTGNSMPDLYDKKQEGPRSIAWPSSAVVEEEYDAIIAKRDDGEVMNGAISDEAVTPKTPFVSPLPPQPEVDKRTHTQAESHRSQRIGIPSGSNNATAGKDGSAAYTGKDGDGCSMGGSRYFIDDGRHFTDDGDVDDNALDGSIITQSDDQQQTTLMTEDRRHKTGDNFDEENDNITNGMDGDGGMELFNRFSANGPSQQESVVEVIRRRRRSSLGQSTLSSPSPPRRSHFPSPDHGLPGFASARSVSRGPLTPDCPSTSCPPPVCLSVRHSPAIFSNSSPSTLPPTVGKVPFHNLNECDGGKITCDHRHNDIFVDVWNIDVVDKVDIYNGGQQQNDADDVECLHQQHPQCHRRHCNHGRDGRGIVGDDGICEDNGFGEIDNRGCTGQSSSPGEGHDHGESDVTAKFRGDFQSHTDIRESARNKTKNGIVCMGRLHQLLKKIIEKSHSFLSKSLDFQRQYVLEYSETIEDLLYWLVYLLPLEDTAPETEWRFHYARAFFEIFRLYRQHLLRPVTYADIESFLCRFPWRTSPVPKHEAMEKDGGKIVGSDEETQARRATQNVDTTQMNLEENFDGDEKKGVKGDEGSDTLRNEDHGGRDDINMRALWENVNGDSSRGTALPSSNNLTHHLPSYLSAVFRFPSPSSLPSFSFSPSGSASPTSSSSRARAFLGGFFSEMMTLVLLGEDSVMSPLATSEEASPTKSSVPSLSASSASLSSASLSSSSLSSSPSPPFCGFMKYRHQKFRFKPLHRQLMFFHRVLRALQVMMEMREYRLAGQNQNDGREKSLRLCWWIELWKTVIASVLHQLSPFIISVDGSVMDRLELFSDRQSDYHSAENPFRGRRNGQQDRQHTPQHLQGNEATLEKHYVGHRAGKVLLPLRPRQKSHKDVGNGNSSSPAITSPFPSPTGRSVFSRTPVSSSASCNYEEDAQARAAVDSKWSDCSDCEPCGNVGHSRDDSLEKNSPYKTASYADNDAADYVGENAYPRSVGHLIRGLGLVADLERMGGGRRESATKSSASNGIKRGQVVVDRDDADDTDGDGGSIAATEALGRQFARLTMKYLQFMKHNGKLILGEALYFLRPLIHLSLMRHYGSTKRWLPWITASVVEVTSLMLIKSHFSESFLSKWMDEEKFDESTYNSFPYSYEVAELMRRQQNLVYIFLRSPFFDTFLSPFCHGVDRMIKRTPVVNLLNFMDVFLAFQHLYFTTSGT